MSTLDFLADLPKTKSVTSEREPDGLAPFASIWNAVCNRSLDSIVFVNCDPERWSLFDIGEIRRDLAAAHALLHANDWIICNQDDELEGKVVDLHLDRTTAAKRARFREGGAIPFIWLSINPCHSGAALAALIATAAHDLKVNLYGHDLVAKWESERALFVGTVSGIIEAVLGGTTDSVLDNFNGPLAKSDGSAVGQVRKEVGGAIGDELAALESYSDVISAEDAAKLLVEAWESCSAFAESRPLASTVADRSEGGAAATLPLIIDLSALGPSLGVAAPIIQQLIKSRDRSRFPLIVLLRDEPVALLQIVRALTLGETHHHLIENLSRPVKPASNGRCPALELRSLILSSPRDVSENDSKTLFQALELIASTTNLALECPVVGERHQYTALLLLSACYYLDGSDESGISKHRALVAIAPLLSETAGTWLNGSASDDAAAGLAAAIMSWVRMIADTTSLVHDTRTLNELFASDGIARRALTLGQRSGLDPEDIVSGVLTYLDTMSQLSPRIYDQHEKRVVPWLDECQIAEAPGVAAWLTMCKGAAELGRREYPAARETFLGLHCVTPPTCEDLDSLRVRFAAARAKEYVFLIQRLEADLAKTRRQAPKGTFMEAALSLLTRRVSQ